ncbi:ABC transporter ATP-binding protein [Paenibacillus frigoriresistens]|uniref:ABC transporter ATP-binding protein n=1 Tax=Paenibacillus alginolyticus TaxID=59839 RepID=UPI0015663476|nr:ABC transporter ATP-binding protein [Paenibacillus frigoriresistens]NRF95868.1 ABC transporter ATP-binding protein [Paenibacillus frigoriresistens]
MPANVLEINDLTRIFKIGGMVLGKKIVAVDKVDLKLPGDKPQIMSIVGESGSGKTTLAKMILRLLDPSSGNIVLGGVPLSVYGKGKNRKEFFKKVQPIFQNPFTSFSMRKTVDTYLYETAINLEIAANKQEALAVVKEVLRSVGLDLTNIAGKYPNQFSGGELQRISIARALIPKPSLIVADEPVAMIDASLRMNIVNLFRKLKDEYNVNFVYITHDLSTAYYVSDYIATMYRGQLIEFGDAKSILNKPSHPYTELLLDSIPRVGKKWDEGMTLPDWDAADSDGPGCKFAGRCKYSQDACRSSDPYMVNIESEHRVLCIKHNGFQSIHTGR